MVVAPADWRLFRLRVRRRRGGERGGVCVTREITWVRERCNTGGVFGEQRPPGQTEREAVKRRQRGEGPSEGEAAEQ
jgi:hypothetical protein